MKISNSAIASSIRAIGVTLISLADQLASDPNESHSSKGRRPRVSSDWLFHHHREAILGMAKQEFENRARRNRVIDAKFLGEPVWDILLYLFPRREAGIASFSTQVCSASGVPPTTGLRYISMLVEQGILSVSVCPFDARRTEVHLTDTGRSLIVRCLLDRLDRLELPIPIQEIDTRQNVVIPLHGQIEPLVEEIK